MVEPQASGSRPALAFTSELQLPPGASAQISLNDSETLAVAAPSPQQHRARARAGENAVDGRLLSQPGGPGRWRFDFRGAPGFVPGSIQVDSGHVLVLDSHGVVFEITGESGAPVRFRFRVED